MSPTHRASRPSITSCTRTVGGCVHQEPGLGDPRRPPGVTDRGPDRRLSPSASLMGRQRGRCHGVSKCPGTAPGAVRGTRQLRRGLWPHSHHRAAGTVQGGVSEAPSPGQSSTASCCCRNASNTAPPLGRSISHKPPRWLHIRLVHDSALERLHFFSGLTSAELAAVLRKQQFCWVQPRSPRGGKIPKEEAVCTGTQRGCAGRQGTRQGRARCRGDTM